MGKTLILMSDMDEKGIEIATKAEGKEITVCLMQNAVYLSAKGKKLFDTLISQNKKIYAIEKDVTIRGLKKDLIYSEVKLIDYAAVIDLVLEHENIINY